MNAEQKVRAALEGLDVNKAMALLDAVADLAIQEREICARIADAQAARFSRQVSRSRTPLIQMAQVEALRNLAHQIRQVGETGKKQIAVGA